MRRNLQEITSAETLEAILQQAEVFRLGMSVDDQPYIVPLSYGYAGGKIYVHGAPEGKKVDMLLQNPRVCFEIEILTALEKRGDTACSWGMRYQSVIGFGTARFLETSEEKRRGLDAIIRHYGGEPPDYPASALEKISVIEIEVEEMTGKRSKD